MKTHTNSEMYYRAQVMVAGNAVTSAEDLLSTAQVLESLLGCNRIENGIIIGVVDVQDYDLELIHKTIEENGSVDIRIGVARSELLASIALVWSDRSGVTFISIEEEDTYLAGIPVIEMQGISPSIARRMRKLQIYTAYDIKYSSREFLLMNFDSTIIAIYIALTATQAPRQANFWYKQISVSSVSATDSVVRPVKQKKQEQVVPAEERISSAVLNLFNYNIGTIPVI